MGDAPVDKTSAEFERHKWDAEFRLREREVAVKEQDAARQDRELDARLQEQKRARWTNPLVLAVFAAALAALGNAGVAYINGQSQHALESDKNQAQITLEREKVEGQQTIEELKAEAARILEVIKTIDPDKAAENLDFLMKSGLIIDKKRREALERFLADRKPGEGPSIPPIGATPVN
jgi:hypothetical protein